MPRTRKYTEPTRPITHLFYVKDMEILSAHATHQRTVTDMIQGAIKDLIAKEGWGPGQTPEQAREPMPEPQAEIEVRTSNTQEDSDLPDYLRSNRKGGL